MFGKCILSIKNSEQNIHASSKEKTFNTYSFYGGERQQQWKIKAYSGIIVNKALNDGTKDFILLFEKATIDDHEIT